MVVRRSNVNIVVLKFIILWVILLIWNVDYFLWKWFFIVIVKIEYEYFIIDLRKYVVVY